MLDYDVDGWPDLFVANDTQPNKLYRNQGRTARSREVAVQAGLAFSEDGRARAGMGTDAADFDNSGVPSVVVTNFSGEMLGLYVPVRRGVYADRAPGSEVGPRQPADARLRLLLLRRRSRRPARSARRQRPHRRRGRENRARATTPSRRTCFTTAARPVRRRRARGRRGLRGAEGRDAARRSATSISMAISTCSMTTNGGPAASIATTSSPPTAASA